MQPAGEPMSTSRMHLRGLWGSALNQKKQGWKTGDIVSYLITNVCNKPLRFYWCNYIYQYMK